MDQYNVLGIMSGSSLDGLDLCLCTFITERAHWQYKMLSSETIGLPSKLKEGLQHAEHLPAIDLLKLNMDYGNWIGRQVTSWLKSHNSDCDLIAIHGHTVFHDPKSKVSLQIGDGGVIAHLTGVPTVDNFRTSDLIKGGQGAPLVPVGEHYLFQGFKAFINLGGIANISIHHPDEILAWDIAPCNQVLNYFSGKLGKPYDHGGKYAEMGKFDKEWFDRTSSLEYFHLPPPKSLSNQWTQRVMQGTLPKPHDALHSYCKFIGQSIGQILNATLKPDDKVLITGGGAFNNFLMQQIVESTNNTIKIIAPDKELIAFKEALIFGFLGLLRNMKRENIFKSVTGAKCNSVGGDIHLP